VVNSIGGGVNLPLLTPPQTLFSICIKHEHTIKEGILGRKGQSDLLLFGVCKVTEHFLIFLLGGLGQVTWGFVARKFIFKQLSLIDGPWEVHQHPAILLDRHNVVNFVDYLFG